jgi:endonuclease/exonuclease/phosphatase family metal-dependent hydrolase
MRAHASGRNRGAALHTGLRTAKSSTMTTLRRRPAEFYSGIRLWAPCRVALSAVAIAAFVAGPAPESAAAQSTVRVVAYNIRHGRGTDDLVDLPRVADVLRQLDADVIALQEVDDRTERTGRVNQVAVLADLLGYRGYHGPHRPYEGGFYGNAVLTRLPVSAVRTHAIPSASGSALAVHEIAVTVEPGRSLSVVSVHLAGSPEERRAQAEAVTRLFAPTEHPVVLAGDFNGRPDDPVVSALRSAWRVLEKSGDPRTYPAQAPDREIDFVMTRPSDPLVPVEHRVIVEPLASDHRPLLAVLSFEPPAR